MTVRDISVGVGIVIRRYPNVLVQRRLTTVGYGCWGFPGGHLEKWESFEEAALRELHEEAGNELQVTDPTYWRAVNSFYPKIDRHDVVIFVISDHIIGEAIHTEPEKAEPWVWCRWEDVPEPRMPGIKTLFDLGLEPWGGWL